MLFDCCKRFIVECFDSNDDNVDGNDLTTHKNRKRGNNRGLGKLLDIQSVLEELESKYGTIAKSKHHDDFNNEVELVRKQLLSSQESSMKRKKEKNTINAMFGSIGKANKTNQRITRKCVGTIMPIFNGRISYTNFCRKKHITEYIEKEFRARGLSNEFQQYQKVSDLKRILRKHEKERFEKEVVTALASFNVVIPPIMNLETKRILLRQKIDDSDDTDIEWADFDVDVEKYFEKQSDEIDDGIVF